MGAKNKVIAGDYDGKRVQISPMSKGCAFIYFGFFAKELLLTNDTVQTYKVDDQQRSTSGTSAVLRGGVGGLLLGPVGLLAAASAKKKGIHIIEITFKDGKQSLLEVDEPIYKAIVAKCFNPKRNDNPSPAPVQSVSAADEIVKYKKLLDDGVITKDEFETKKKQLLGMD